MFVADFGAKLPPKLSLFIRWHSPPRLELNMRDIVNVINMSWLYFNSHYHHYYFACYHFQFGESRWLRKLFLPKNLTRESDKIVFRTARAKINMSQRLHSGNIYLITNFSNFRTVFRHWSDRKLVQQTFSCSNLTTTMLEKGVKSVQS